MPQYQVRVLRVQTVVLEAPSTDEAERLARTLVARDPDMKLLDVIRTDLLEPTTTQGQSA